MPSPLVFLAAAVLCGVAAGVLLLNLDRCPPGREGGATLSSALEGLPEPPPSERRATLNLFAAVVLMVLGMAASLAALHGLLG